MRHSDTQKAPRRVLFALAEFMPARRRSRAEQKFRQARRKHVEALTAYLRTPKW